MIHYANLDTMQIETLCKIVPLCKITPLWKLRWKNNKNVYKYFDMHGLRDNCVPSVVWILLKGHTHCHFVYFYSHAQEMRMFHVHLFQVAQSKCIFYSRSSIRIAMVWTSVLYKWPPWIAMEWRLLQMTQFEFRLYSRSLIHVVMGWTSLLY